MVNTLFTFLILSAVSLLAGNRLLSFFRCSFRGSEEEMVFSYAAGLALLSYMVLGLGITGMLEKRNLWMGVGGIALLGVPQIPHLVELFKKKTRTRTPVWLEVIFWFIAALIGVGVFIPLAGSDGLAYHLTCPKMFLWIKRVDWIPDDINSTFPFFMEMLSVLGLALKGESLARLFHWSTGVLLALAASNFFTRFFASRTWGRITGLFLLLTPGIFNEMRAPLVEVAWAAYGFLGFYALLIGIRDKDKGWFLLSSVFLGITLGIKYLGALSVIAAFAVFVFFAWTSKWKVSEIFRWGALMSAVALALSGYWYLKAYLVHGNPVYPYFHEFFGFESVNVGGAGSYAPGEYAEKGVGMGRSFWSLLLLPFNLTLFPRRFDGWAEQIGPAYLVFLPFLFRGLNSPVRIALALYAGIFTLGWFWLGQVTRFLYPALPFLALLMMGSFYLFLRRRPQNRFYPLLLTAVFLLQGSILLYHSRHGGAALIGRETKEEFLMKRERSFPLAKFVNENLPLGAKILNSEEVRTFYFDRLMIRESLYRFRTEYDEALNWKQAFQILKKDGFTHILIAGNWQRSSLRAPEGRSNDVGIYQWVGPDSKVKNLKQIYRSTFQERDGRAYDYALYELK